MLTVSVLFDSPGDTLKGLTVWGLGLMGLGLGFRV